MVSSAGASGLGKREGPGWWPLLQLLLENHGKNVHIVQKAKNEMRQPGDEVALQDSSVAGGSEARARLSTRMAGQALVSFTSSGRRDETDGAFDTGAAARCVAGRRERASPGVVAQQRVDRQDVRERERRPLLCATHVERLRQRGAR